MCLVVNYDKEECVSRPKRRGRSASNRVSDQELEVRKSNIRLMRSLINRFKDKHKDYTEEWRKSELGDIRKTSSIVIRDSSLTLGSATEGGCIFMLETICRHFGSS